MKPSVLRVPLITFFLLVSPAASAEDTKPSMSDIVEAWLVSPHGDPTSEAFTHWNEDGTIPGECAVCHSSRGAVAYVQGPMSTPGGIDHPVGIGTSVDCVVCHSRAGTDIASVPFASGVVIDLPRSSAICSVCHQGRASTDTVIEATSGFAEDDVVADLRFINVHYAPSAATQMGGSARIGFEYPGKTYKGRFDHVPNFGTCTDCHNPHSLQVELEGCTTCHQGAESFADIRISPVDFDGDGNTTEGIASPIATLHARLEEAMQSYAKSVAGTPIVYTSSAYPYFFVDGDGDGTASDDEAAYPNRFQSWTPRLLKAAYNYQLVAKEPAIFTHNPHYALQLLYDSLESLSETVDVDLADLTRP